MFKQSHALSKSQRFLIRSVLIIVIGLFINQLLQTLGSIVLARVLDDPQQFGEANLLLQIFGMVGLFLNVGFNSALVYQFSTDAEQARRNDFRYALVGSAFFGVVVSLLVAALSPLLAGVYHLPNLQGALVICSIMLIFNSVLNMGVSAFAGNRDFSKQAFFMVLTTTFSTLGTIVGVVLPLKEGDFLWGISFWMGIGAAITATLVGLQAQRVHKPDWIGPVPLKELRRMMAYGVPMWAGNIAKAFQQPFLVMVIGSGSVAAVGYLANGLRITGFIGIVTWAFMIVTFPFVAESSQNWVESKRRGMLCIRYNNYILYPLTLLICLFPNEINGALFGTSYSSQESGIYIILLALGVLFSSVGRLGGSILAGIGRTKANFWVMIVAGIGVVGIVPFIAAAHPVLSVSIYTGGWALSALCTIWFFHYEGFVLDWRKAYGEPLLPTAAMGVMLEIGQWTGAWFPLFIAVGVALLVLGTLYLERKDAASGARISAVKP
ncbi:oligosaccharide flippase family protein [Paenibacillus chartarius]|uniref:Oligosaccharide flippase family protein n=1 Tax=Paenibacillus chartarius TaxID=747481 RepID=A0ABV6DFP6_9BACL